MAIRTKASLVSLFEDGDKPTGTDFNDLVDSIVAIPTAASFPCIVEVEGTTSATARPIGAVGVRLIEASATSQAQDALGIGAAVSAGTVGAIITEAGTTASAQNAIGLDGETISGFVLSPKARLYTLEQRNRRAFTVDWIAAQVSAGHCAVTLLTDTSIITGFSSAAVDTTEIAASASGGSGNLIAVGESLNIRVSDVSSPDALSFSIGVTH